MTEEVPHEKPERKKPSLDSLLLPFAGTIIALLAAAGIFLSYYDNVPQPTTKGQKILETGAISATIYQRDGVLEITVPDGTHINNLSELCSEIRAEFPNDCQDALGPLENDGPFGDKQPKVVLPVEDGQVILGGYNGSEKELIEFLKILSTAEGGDRFTAEDLAALTLKVGKGVVTTAAVSAALWLSKTGYQRLSDAKQERLVKKALNNQSTASSGSSKSKKNTPAPNPLKVEATELSQKLPPMVNVQTKFPAEKLGKPLTDVTSANKEADRGVHPLRDVVIKKEDGE